MDITEPKKYSTRYLVLLVQMKYSTRYLVLLVQMKYYSTRCLVFTRPYKALPFLITRLSTR